MTPLVEKTVEDGHIFCVFVFSQNDAEQETEKDDAPGSPASHSGGPHHCFLLVLIMDGCTQSSHIDQIFMTFIDVSQRRILGISEQWVFAF